MSPEIFDQSDPESGDTQHTRRSFVSLLVAVPFALGGGIGATVLALAKDGEDDDDDEDNSGHGNSHDDDDDREDEIEDHGGDPRADPALEGVTAIDIIDEAFVPNHIAISTGQTVTWSNLDDDDHTASGRGMDTGVLATGATGSVEFLEPGEYEYTCNFHPEMLGLIVVTGPSLVKPEASPIALPMKAEVDIVDFGFEPSTVTVGVGAEVTWSNSGSSPHTVTGTFADSDILDAGASYTFDFAEAGQYEYVCALHPGMTGTIIVKEQSVSATPVASHTADVEIVDFGFEPADVTVQKGGGTVNWSNVGASPHTVTGEFADSDIMDTGTTFEFTFTEPGVYPYACLLHANMVGTVTVLE